MNSVCTKNKWKKKFIECRVYVYMSSVSPHDVQYVSGSLIKYTSDMIVDKISGIVTSITKQYYTCIGQLILFIE